MTPAVPGTIDIELSGKLALELEAGEPAPVTDPPLATEILDSEATRLPRTKSSLRNPMACLLELSHELLHCIFLEIDPVDLAALSQSCRSLHGYVRGNRLLHKDLYLRRYDQPRVDNSATNDAKAQEKAAGDTLAQLDWEDGLRRRVKLEKILDSENKLGKREHLGFVAREIVNLVESADTEQEESRNMQLLRERFKVVDNVDTFLCASSLFERVGNELRQPAGTAELRQLSAKLHCLSGVPIDTLAAPRGETVNLDLSPSSCTRSHSREFPTHPYARSKVYDLREYTDNTLWGPFMSDGSQRVDWEKVEAVMVVLGYNLMKFHSRSNGRFPLVWRQTWLGATPRSYKAAPRIGPPKELDEETLRIRELALSLDALDPYGVSGSWMRVVCFLDYTDLFTFNFGESIPDDQLRGAIDIEEGLIDLLETLQVTRVNPPGSGDNDEEEDGMDWSNFKGQRLPVVHFRGTSRSLHASWDPNANSRIRGSVRQTPEGEIRWTTFSIFHGEERWRSEGVQVGGIRSARGVLGNWFDKDYDVHGPAGPTAFWKESDEFEEERTSRDGSAMLAHQMINWIDLLTSIS